MEIPGGVKFDLSTLYLSRKIKSYVEHEND